MAFPGTYNFSYYKGDSFEFNIYPKTSSGAVFDLSQYDKTSGAKFTIAEERGDSGYSSQIICDALISEDSSYITCTINPEQGNLLNARISYEYDVEISRDQVVTADPLEIKKYVYTLVSGRVAVTDQITGAAPPVVEGL
jgi:hypothetical protein